MSSTGSTSAKGGSGPVLAAAFADPGLEAAVLAALARDQDVYWRYAEDYLVPDTFSDPAHRQAFLALAEFHAGRGPLPSLPAADPPLDLDTAARTLADLAQRRKAAEVVSQFWADLGAGKPVGDVLAAAMERLAEAQQAVRILAPGEVIALPDLLARARADLAEKARLLQETGRPTPHPSFGPDQPTLTELLGGFQPGVYVLGGQPNLGKTFLALTWAHRYVTAERDTVAVWVDINEMRPVHKLGLYLACVHAKKNPYAFERCLADPREFDQISAQAEAALGARFAVMEGSTNTTAAHIRGAVRRAKARTGAKRVMVVIDFMQKLCHTAMGGNFFDLRQRMIAAVTALGDVVKAADGPVLVISSLNRAAYGRGAKGNEASVADYKESGDIEYQADVGLQLRWADDPRNKDRASAVKALDCHVVKNRFGPTGTVRLYSLRTEARFTETDPGNVSLPPLLRDAPGAAPPPEEDEPPPEELDVPEGLF